MEVIVSRQEGFLCSTTTVSDILVFPGSHIIAIEIEMFHLLQLCIIFYMQCITFSAQAEMQQKTAACSSMEKRAVNVRVMI